MHNAASTRRVGVTGRAGRRNRRRTRQRGTGGSWRGGLRVRPPRRRHPTRWAGGGARRHRRAGQPAITKAPTHGHGIRRPPASLVQSELASWRSGGRDPMRAQPPSHSPSHRIGRRRRLQLAVVRPAAAVSPHFARHRPVSVEQRERERERERTHYYELPSKSSIPIRIQLTPCVFFLV
jgi:hypothetical protein